MIALTHLSNLQVTTAHEAQDVPRLQKSILGVCQMALNTDIDSNGRNNIATLLGFLEDLILDEQQTERGLKLPKTAPKG